MPHGRILFISDLHLDATAPATNALFMRFLRSEAAASDALYILGDLFETWIGDDDDEPARQGITAALRELTAGGTPCFIQHGNRDFLLGAGFAEASGCKLLTDPALLEIGQRTFALTHGDQLCTGDRRYQRFRGIVRKGSVQRVWSALPLAARRRLAVMLRQRSRDYTRSTPGDIMDVTPSAVLALFRSTGAQVLIHGHTHRPTVHAIDVDGHERTRIVLGDWPDRASMLEVDASGQFTVRTLPTR